MVIVALALCAAGYVWVWLVCDSQADQIDEMSQEIETLRHDSEYWPTLIRAELLRMEMRLRAWMEERDGAGRKR